MEPKLIASNGRCLAIVLREGDWLDEGFRIHTPDSEFVQVCTWVYPEGKHLAAHAHKQCPRTSDHTQEVVHIVSGRIVATLYNTEDVPVADIELRPRDTLIVLDGGHSYRILENGTRVLEVKNGPYPGLEADKRTIPAAGR